MRPRLRRNANAGSAAVGLGQGQIIASVSILLLAIIVIGFVTQFFIERDTSGPPAPTPKQQQEAKEQREVAKLLAEIQKIRSDTIGSLFWLKVVALLVTVGGAVGGYLMSHERSHQMRLDFEHRKEIDAAYQSLVQELADESPLLRAAAAVKLGAVLRSFPSEWDVSAEHESELIDLTRKILAASLAIEREPKVLKALSIALVLYRPWDDKPDYGDVRDVDLSGVRASDAYWARVDFTGADFFKARLTKTSFRKSILREAKFREAHLRDAVLANADCRKANFKLADLRGADLSGAKLEVPISKVLKYMVQCSPAQPGMRGPWAQWMCPPKPRVRRWLPP